MKKRLLSLALACVLAFSVLPSGVFAQPETVPIEASYALPEYETDNGVKFQSTVTVPKYYGEIELPIEKYNFDTEEWFDSTAVFSVIGVSSDNDCAYTINTTITNNIANGGWISGEYDAHDWADGILHTTGNTMPDGDASSPCGYYSASGSTLSVHLPAGACSVYNYYSYDVPDYGASGEEGSVYTPYGYDGYYYYIASEYMLVLTDDMVSSYLSTGKLSYDDNNSYPGLYEVLTGASAPWSAASDWAIPELTNAYNSGLIPECLESCDMTRKITRAEFAAAAVKLYEVMSGTTAVAGENPFTDTDDEEVLKAYNLGITKGTSETTFSPYALLDRQQAATMLARVYTSLGGEMDASGSAFADDGSIQPWAKDSVYFMSSKGIIKGVGNNTFAPASSASREAALLIAARMLDTLK